MINFILGKKGQTSLPDATNIVGIRSLIVVVRVAIRQIHVPGIRSVVLRKRPKVVSGNFFCCRLLFHQLSSLTSRVERFEVIPILLFEPLVRLEVN